MRDDPLNYDRLMEDALRGVVRRALSVVGERGLTGQHHFYITFRTDLAGVDIPDSLRRRYPKEMTIVLQHQFWGLEIGAEKFEVTLSFDSKHERLVVPFAAVTAFVDPSVQFGLQFEPSDTAEPPAAKNLPAAPAASAVAAPAETASTTSEEQAEEPAKPSEGAEVVRLDRFRKK